MGAIQTVNGRIPPALPAAAMKTYRVLAPLKTHWRRATCAEVQCGAYLFGWTTRLDESTEQGQRAAYYIRHDKTREHREEHTVPGLTDFVFPPGQRGFASQNAAEDHSKHVIRIDRPERFLVTGGDWRGNPTRERREHVRAADWAEDFAGHQDRLRAAIERG